MSTSFCVRCKKKHDSYQWSHRKWLTPDGVKEGWGCAEDIRLSSYEHTTQEIKEGRKQYAKELLQPYRGGDFSKEYRDAYPDISRKMVEAGVITQKQHDKAKNVWKGDVPTP